MSPPGPLFQGELQVSTPSSPPKDPAGDQWQEQPDPAEEHGHAGPADAARERHDAWHAATTYGERTHTYEHTTATAHGEIIHAHTYAVLSLSAWLLQSFFHRSCSFPLPKDFFLLLLLLSTPVSCLYPCLALFQPMFSVTPGLATNASAAAAVAAAAFNPYLSPVSPGLMPPEILPSTPVLMASSPTVSQVPNAAAAAAQKLLRTDRLEVNDRLISTVGPSFL